MLYRPQQELPAHGGQPEADEDGREQRHQPERANLAELVHDLLQADPADGHPEEHCANGYPDPNLAPHRSAGPGSVIVGPGTPARGRRGEPSKCWAPGARHQTGEYTPPPRTRATDGSCPDFVRTRLRWGPAAGDGR